MIEKVHNFKRKSWYLKKGFPLFLLESFILNIWIKEEFNMYSYTFIQWILFFFIYCFLGWIWECLYVSIKGSYRNKKWTFVNRGFLNGPFIPIYGFAAISILLTTIHLRTNTIAVFIIGALTATLFELITGYFMEKIFKVKYWDYSDRPLNFKGYICLHVSIFLGIFIRTVSASHSYTYRKYFDSGTIFFM